MQQVDDHVIHPDVWPVGELQWVHHCTHCIALRISLSMVFNGWEVGDGEGEDGEDGRGLEMVSAGLEMCKGGEGWGQRE